MAYSSALEALLHPWSGRLDRALDFPPLEPLNIQLRPLNIGVKPSTFTPPEYDPDCSSPGTQSAKGGTKLAEERLRTSTGGTKRSSGLKDDSVTATIEKEGRRESTVVVRSQLCEKHRLSQCLEVAKTAQLAPQTPVLKQTPSIPYQNECFKIDRSKIAGWGAFAAKDLALGNAILKEIPLFVADLSTLYREFNKLDQLAKEIAFSLHMTGGKLETPPIKRVWDTNCFDLGIGKFAGLFPIAARFNHACNPANNIDFRFDRRRGHLKMTVRVEKIMAGDELTISYGYGRSPLELYLGYGFQCRCGACEGLSDEEVQRLNEAQW